MLTNADTSPDAFWRAALADGRILLQRSVAGGPAFLPPRVAEPGTGDIALRWIEASGLGTIYSLTWINQKPPAPPYNVALIDLDEGVRLMSRVDADNPATIVIGQRVRAAIVEQDGGPLIVFKPEVA